MRRGGGECQQYGAKLAHAVTVLEYKHDATAASIASAKKS